MLELRPICEHCATELPPAAPNAMICSFECTFCRECVEHVLENVCPNCGGGFVPRPVRPRVVRHDGAFLGNFPAATDRRHHPVDPQMQRALVDAIGSIPPADR